MIEEPGIYEIDADTYHRDPTPTPSLNNSLIGDLLDCPLRAWWRHPALNPKWAPDEPSAKLDLGAVAHKLLLGQGRALEIIDAADYRAKSAQERRDTAREQGKIPVLGHQFETANEMVDAIKFQLEDFDGLRFSDFDTGKKEVGLFWQEENGCWARNLIDWLRDDLPQWESWDYKSTGTNINPETLSLGIHFVEMGYATQCAMQERGLTSVYPKLAGRIKFRRLFQETEPPYLISVVEPDPATMTIAHKQVERAFQIWHECLSKDEWPGYPKKIMPLRHAEFLANRWLERELADLEAGRVHYSGPSLKLLPGRPPGKYSRGGKRILAPRQLPPDQTIIDAG